MKLPLPSASPWLNKQIIHLTGPPAAILISPADFQRLPQARQMLDPTGPALSIPEEQAQWLLTLI